MLPYELESGKKEKKHEISIALPSASATLLYHALLSYHLLALALEAAAAAAAPTKHHSPK